MTTTPDVDSGAGGQAHTFGPTMARSATLYLVGDEDQTRDGKRRHRARQVGYVVFGSALVDS